MQPITIANMEGKDETTRRVKAVDAMVRLQNNIMENMTVPSNEDKQKQFLDGMKTIYKLYGLKITDEDITSWNNMMATSTKK